ncbi:MAG: hypothetical protein LBN27_10895 [Prevotellaceae bacterium]|jgi:hypothetical protein|nr:hypothetical protein [Prevotellaceae bacterium]
MKNKMIIMFLFVCSCAFGQTTYQSYINEADAAYMDKNYEKALESFQSALKLNLDMPLYNAACVAALAGKKELAFEWLNKAFEKGFYDARHLQKDNDLISLHDNPQWEKLVAIMQKKLDEIEANYDKPLQEKLLTIFADDQEIRQKFILARNKFGLPNKQVDSLAQIMRYKDSLNLIKIEEILDKYGWVGEDKVGKQASATLFLVIQHSDLATQKKYLQMLREAVKNNNASPVHLAMLEDRILVREGKKQLYGSQLDWNAELNKNVLSPLEDPDNVDNRRASVGLPPLADYLKNWGIDWNVEEYKKELEKNTK